MSIKPYKINISQADIDDLAERLKQTRWPNVIKDIGWERGVPQAYLKKMVDHWAHHYDWRKQETALNEFPQFMATVDGQPIHFFHVQSAEPGALPLLLLHGYPGSSIDYVKMIDMLVNASKYGGGQAFHVVVPTIPGFGLSSPVTTKGWDVSRTATALAKIMAKLGYARYGVTGGDVGAGICEDLCINDGAHIIGSLIQTDPSAIATEYTPPTDHLTKAEKETLQGLKMAQSEWYGYLAVQTTRPATIGYALNDSPVGQLAWIVEKFNEWTDPKKELPENAVDIDQLLTNISLYWFTKSGAGAAQFLYETAHSHGAWGQTHTVPAGFVVFGKHPLVRRILDPQNKLTHWTEFEKGGHFASMETPELLVDDLRKFFSNLQTQK